ncbi:hypothetical protein I0C86_38290 [Plantactinospora sp. S1510]|uniref:Uncharacterized protein n=1 Tax=Plantactinospora alkalitolerans TaxID=2789879 RepID=A0ABS0H8E4_9ACTN|nr:hypothetical protein [Plantactinospora alkalitolerans]MBF9134740.1 hypothetical protein [Plantactinospora alkalitolerans]
MIDDDYIPGEGDVMPAVWWRVADHFDLTKRLRSSEIPGHPLIAFADEFTSTLRTAGPLYVDLARYTAWDTTSSRNPIERQISQALTDTFPGMFSIVIGAAGPDVSLALRLTRLTDGIATALLEQHGRYQAHRRSPSQ